MKSLLFHAIQPANPGQNWDDFLFDSAALVPLGTKKLAPNVWLLPADDATDMTYHHLAQLGHQHGIETRCLVFVHKSEWQPLSPGS
jgi:hypothetical protein